MAAGVSVATTVAVGVGDCVAARVAVKVGEVVDVVVRVGVAAFVGVAVGVGLWSCALGEAAHIGAIVPRIRTSDSTAARCAATVPGVPGCFCEPLRERFTCPSLLCLVQSACRTARVQPEYEIHTTNADMIPVAQRPRRLSG